MERRGQTAIPPPDDQPGGPDTPLELGRRGWRQTLKRTGRRLVLSACTDPDLSKNGRLIERG